MKKFIAIIAVAGLLASMAAVPARAGDHGWATAGKILTGFIGLSILGHAIADSQPAYYYAPPPRVYYAPPRENVWVPGHRETRYERRWVPGHWEIERYDSDDWGEYDDDAPRSGRVWVSGRYERVAVDVWIPGHWEERG